jgi:4-amino-4-deoxy-L-arabinose transferase-like glycosyltransferase
MGESPPPYSHEPHRTAFSHLVSNPRIQLGVVLTLAVAIIFSKLGGNGLANYDDCFYAQKAKEILKTGELMTMHFNDQPAWENPPFFMWLIALSYKLFGVNEFAAKFPSAFFGVATVFLVYVIARKVYDSWVAFFSSFVLTTTFIFTRYARHAMMDVALSFFVCLSIFALLLALDGRRQYLIVWGLCIAVCILIKSVLGFYPLLITVIYLLATKQWRILFDKYFLLGSGVLLAVGCSWYVDQYIAFGQQFVDAHFGWVIYTRGFNLEQQAWYDHLTYVEDLFRYYWPWLPVFVVSVAIFIRRAWAKDTIAILFLLWSCLIIIMMSMMQSRVLWYIMPMFPAAAIMCGSVTSTFFGAQTKILVTQIVLVLTVAVAVILNATSVSLESDRERDVREIAPYVRDFAKRGVHIVAFRQDYYGLNNALLFYSDAAAYPLYQDYASLSAAFASDTLVLCILKSQDLNALDSNIFRLHVIKKTDELVLATNQAVSLQSR